MSVVDKVKMERETASFFCDWFNENYKTDYEAIKDKFDRDCDYLLKSSNPNWKNIDLQVTTCDHEIIEAIKPRKKLSTILSFVPYLDFEVDLGFDPKYEECILRAIKEKSGKYPKDIEKELILLVYSDFFAKFNPSYLKKHIEEKCSKNYFKNIYLIELPKCNSAAQYPARDGNCILLK